MSTMIQIIIDGLAMGLIYVILAAGNVLICSINKMIFVAYGMFYTIGAYFIWFMVEYTSIPYFLALLLAAAATGAVGLIAYVLAFQKHQLRITQGGFLATMIASMGLNMILNQAVLLVFGTTYKSVPSVFEGRVKFWGVTMSKDKIMMMAVGIAIAVVLFLIYTKTNVGRAMQAVSIDADTAALQGIRPNRIYMLSLGIASVVAGLAGGIIAPSYGINPDMGSNILWTVMLMTMLGGMDSLLGSVVGGIVIGELLSFGQFYIGGQIQLIIFLVVGVVLYFRPNGLMGHTIDIGI